jgi:nitrate reductase NapE component
MGTELRGLNIPFPPRDHWRTHVVIAVVMFAVLLYGVAGAFGRVFLAATLIYLPGLALFVFGGNALSRLGESGRSGDLQKLLFWVLVGGYIALAKSVLLPLAIRGLEHVA